MTRRPPTAAPIPIPALAPVDKPFEVSVGVVSAVVVVLGLALEPEVELEVGLGVLGLVTAARNAWTYDAGVNKGKSVEPNVTVTTYGFRITPPVSLVKGEELNVCNAVEVPE